MPNWCNNTLAVRGSKKQLMEFKKKVKSEDSELCMDNLIREPNKFRNLEYLTGDVSKWRHSNWGTRCDITDAELWDEGDDFLVYHFVSKWCPPDQFILHSSKKYKKLSFQLRYDEPGMGFVGLFRTRKGFIVEDEVIDDGDFWKEKIEK